MRNLLTHSCLLLVAGALPAAAAGAQTTAIGLSTVRAQRFGNEAVGGQFTPQSTDLFGYTLASGDFNGDGADDLATGMPYDNGAASTPIIDSGSVMVRFGSQAAGLASGGSGVYLRQAGTYEPPETGDNYGWSLAACDLNNDGFGDLAVGVPYERYLSHNYAGVVEVYYGGPAGLPATASTLFAESTPGVPGDVEAGDRFGWSLGCADFNGDGFDDLAVGVPGEAWGGFGLSCPPGGGECAFGMGMVVLVPGSSDGLAFGAASELDQDVDGMGGGGESNDQLGYSLAAGNFDGDGFADLAIGVPGEDDDEGQLQVVFGSAAGLTATGSLFWSESFIGGTSMSGDRFTEVMAAGDLDGDGFTDLAIGAPYKEVGAATNAGEVSVLYGSPAGFNRDRTQLWPENAVNGPGASEPYDSFGYALASGDFDRDGRADLAIGHPAESIVGAQDGAATILMGSGAGLTVARHREIVAGNEGFPGDLLQHGKYFGYALGSGDFDGDGHADLAIASPWENEAGIADAGAETVLYGALFADGGETGNTNLWSQNVSSVYFNKIRATGAAKLGPLTSNVGLQVDLFAPSLQRPATATYVRVGPEAGFHDEHQLSGTFFIDPQNLTMSNVAGSNSFQVMAFTDSVGTGSRTRLAFVLNHTGDGWFVNAFHFNEATGLFQFSGGGFFACAATTCGNPASFHNTRIDWAWTAGNPGHVTMSRTRFVGGAPDANGPVQMFSIDLPGMGGAVINHAFAGMFAGQRAGTYGALYLDELSFRR